MLAVKRSAAGVTPEVNLREYTSHVPLLSTNKASHPEETSPEVQNRGISGPIERHVGHQKFKKKHTHKTTTGLRP